MTDLHKISGVEVFKVGKWNGEEYFEADLDAMCDAFNHVGYRPPLKLGHSTDIGGKAFGWVERIYRRGQILLAGLCDVPREILQAIKDRSFDTVSAEICWNLDRGGKIFKRALKAIALLGAEVPAVAGLAPL